MLLLLGIFYFLVIKNNPFTTKGTSTENKSFFSLFSKSKDKDLNVIDDTNTDTGSGNDTSGNLNGNTDTGNQDDVSGNDDSNTGNQNNVNNQYQNKNLKLRPIPRPDYDPIDYPNINPTIVPTVVPPVPNTEKAKQCNLDDYKLKFTAEEQAELDRLLRDFYRIASSIKTEEDIEAENEARLSYISLANEAKDLTKQCYEQTDGKAGIPQTIGGVKYMTGFDWNNALKEQHTTPKGQLISTNFSRSTEARLERKGNPFYIAKNTGTGSSVYFFTAEILNRSPRYNVADNFWTKSNDEGTTMKTSQKYPGTAEGYAIPKEVPGVAFRNTIDGTLGFVDSVEAQKACKEGLRVALENEKKKWPSDYILSGDCQIIDGTPIFYGIKSNADHADKKFWRALAIYPMNNKVSPLLQREWFYGETDCEKRAGDGNCSQPLRDEPRPTKGVQVGILSRIDWVYGISFRSATYPSLVYCQKIEQAYGGKVIDKCGSATTNATDEGKAYIQKVWTKNDIPNYIDVSGEGTADPTYIAPYDYDVFEEMLNIW